MAPEHDLHLGVKANVNDAQKQIEKLVNHISKLENEVKKAGKSNLNNLNRSLQQTASISSQLKSGFGKFTDSLSQLPGVVGSATTGIRSFIAASGPIALVTVAVTSLIKVFDDLSESSQMFGDSWAIIKNLVCDMAIPSIKTAVLSVISVLATQIQDFLNLSISGINLLIEGVNKFVPAANFSKIAAFEFGDTLTKKAEEARAALVDLATASIALTKINDEIGTQEIELKSIRGENEQIMAEQRMIAQDTTKSIKEREAAYVKYRKAQNEIFEKERAVNELRKEALRLEAQKALNAAGIVVSEAKVNDLMQNGLRSMSQWASISEENAKIVDAISDKTHSNFVDLNNQIRQSEANIANSTRETNRWGKTIKGVATTIEETIVEGSLEDLRKKLADAQKDLEKLEIGSMAFKDKQKVIEDLEKQIKDALNTAVTNVNQSNDKTDLDIIKDMYNKDKLDDAKSDLQSFYEWLSTQAIDFETLNEELLEQYREKYNGFVRERQENEADISRLKQEQKDVRNLAATYGNLADAVGNWAEASEEARVAQQALTTVERAFTAVEATLAAVQAAKTAGKDGDPYTVAARVAAAVAAIAGAVFSAQQIGSQRFEQGGVVAGNSFSGDKIAVRVNSGEMILNKGQQANLFKIIQDGGSVGNNSKQNVEFRINGADLVGVLEQQNKIARL